MRPIAGLVRTTAGRRGAFVTLAVAIVVVAAAHLFVIQGLTTIRLGLPVWLWLQLGVITALLGLAWLAVELVPEPEIERRRS